MKDTEIIETFEKWQNDIMTSTKLVHVNGFKLSPQSVGFWLQLELYIADQHDGDLDNPHKDFFGTIGDCVVQGLVWIDEETKRIRELL